MVIAPIASAARLVQADVSGEAVLADELGYVEHFQHRYIPEARHFPFPSTTKARTVPSLVVAFPSA